LAKDKGLDEEYFGVDSFLPIGIRLPRGMRELLQPGQQLRSQVLFVLERGGRLKAVGMAQLDGRPMTRVVALVDNPAWRIAQEVDLAALEQILRSNRATPEDQVQKRLAVVKSSKHLTPRKLEAVIYLDPEYGYAVRRWQDFTEDGRLCRQADSTGHKKLAGHEIWLPSKCRIDSYS